MLMLRISQSNNQLSNSDLLVSQKNITDHDISKNKTENELEKTNAKEELLPEERKQVEELKQIERKVVAHEQAHKSVGGQLAGSMSYSYSQGPDGRRYKTGGEVSISIPSDDDPQKLIAQLMQVKRAALAPSNPSPQDIKVAGMADGKLQAARAKLREVYSESKQLEADNSIDLKI